MNEGAREANEEIFRNSVLNKFDQIIAHNKEADESEQTIAQLRADLAARDKQLEEARKVINEYVNGHGWNIETARAFLAAHPETRKE